jgi:hypothetical protein
MTPSRVVLKISPLGVVFYKNKKKKNKKKEKKNPRLTYFSLPIFEYNRIKN